MPLRDLKHGIRIQHEHDLQTKSESGWNGEVALGTMRQRKPIQIIPKFRPRVVG